MLPKFAMPVRTPILSETLLLIAPHEKKNTECVAAQSGCTLGGLCSEGQDDSDSATGIGASDSSESEDTELAGESSGDSITYAATLAFVLPVVLSGIAALL